MAFEMACRIWLVDILGVDGEVHEEIHNQQAEFVSCISTGRWWKGSLPRYRDY